MHTARGDTRARTGVARSPTADPRKYRNHRIFLGRYTYIL